MIMKFFMYSVFTALLILSVNILNAQTEKQIRLLNGKTDVVLKYSVDYDANMFYYQTEKPTGKLVTRSVLLEDVFSYTDSLNELKIVYAPIDEEQMSVKDMDAYVQGSSFARTEYKPYLALAGGFIVSGVGVFIFDNPVVGLSFPIVYSASMALVKPSRDEFILRHPQYADDEAMLYGYQRSGKNKTVKYGVIGSAGGAIIGLIIKSILSEN
ncbi:MAG: hypothetical protein PF448_07000 [Bacteroidales bacterium]|jgi:hypothetical protein|nr:hypothetical protein [Bacteroidales bacterium]